MNTVHAIPTTYKGVQFRSRLEARWAAMFDLIGWKWAYEPIDLAGYIPDFVMTNFLKETIIEVKPALHPDEIVESQGKVDRSGWTGETIIVGAMLWENTESSLQGIRIGSIREDWGSESNPCDAWSECHIAVCSHNNLYDDRKPCGMFTPLNWGGAWKCRLCGVNGKHYWQTCESELKSAWVQAGNKVQWRRKR